MPGVPIARPSLWLADLLAGLKPFPLEVVTLGTWSKAIK